MLKNPNFPGLRTRTPLGELTVRATVLGSSIRPRFYGSQGLTHYRIVNHKYDYYSLLLIHNNAYSYLLVLYS